MTVVHAEKNYLESPYLENPYLGTDVTGSMGHQAQIVINSATSYGMQCQIQIVDFPAAKGQQANLSIVDSTTASGMQADIAVETRRAIGQQAELNIVDRPAAFGQQVDILIGVAPFAFGMQFKRDNIAHLDCMGYLEEGYLEGAYLVHGICAHAAMQAELLVTNTNEIGQQSEIHIDNRLSAIGQQSEIHIVDFKKSLGQQSSINVSLLRAFGMQAEIQFNDVPRFFGLESEISIVDAKKPIGMQVELIHQLAIGMQVTIALYSPTNLRILCDFPSRGLAGSVGLNAWGNTSGQGENWKSNSTESGDFSEENLNTDIVEQVWRSNAPTTTGINLDCDTERAQGVFLDTLAVLNHNITSSATVTLIGSNTDDFSVVGVSIPLEVRSDDPNIYYVAPTLPNQGYRYWRLSIDDSSNSDGFVEIGTIIFGSSTIFIGECFVDEVIFQLKDFTDSVQTEGFTNANNSRAQKKQLQLEFRSLSYLKGNFRAMRSMFRRERTVLKCLWIPTPDPDNQELTSRFALFSKLAEIPSERHNHKGGTADYVSFTIQLDESK